MSFFDKIKDIFNFKKEKKKNDFNNEEEMEVKENITEDIKNNEKMKNDTENANTKQKEIQILAEKAFEAKVNGEYKKALKLWDNFCNEYPEAKAQAKARKAKIYIILGKNEKAENELIEFFEWYSNKGSFDYSSSYFTVFISALQDLGFYVGEWADSKDYLKNISGEDVSLDKNLTMKRIQKGLDYLKKNDIWSSSLEEVEKNLGMLS